MTNKKSEKSFKLNQAFEEKPEQEKANHYNEMVHDLKTSNPGQWYSKAKRLSGQERRSDHS